MTTHRHPAAADVRRVLQQAQELLDDGPGQPLLDTSVQVRSWDEVVENLRRFSLTADAVAVLSPTDMPAVDMEAQEDSGAWPPPCPIVSLDATWVLTVVEDGRIMLVRVAG